MTKSIFLIMLFISLFVNLNLQASVIFSGEIGGNSVIARNKVETLDDIWRASFLNGTTFDRQSILNTAENTNNFEIIFPENIVTVGLYDYTSTSETLATKGFDIETNSTFSLQNGAPYPASLYKTNFVGENVGSDSSLNAIKFSFKNPSFGFGAYFGDLETRNDGSGKPAKVILKFLDGTYASPVSILNRDLSGNLLNESLCGSPNPSGDDFEGCGNKTTKWISFQSDKAVAEMLVIVGDDDYTGQTNGFGEHFSFVGPTIANLPVSSSSSSLTLNSSINSSFSSSSISSSSSSVISSFQNPSFGSISSFGNLKSNFSSSFINASVFNQNSSIINSSAATSSIDKKTQNSQGFLEKEISKQVPKSTEQAELEIKPAEIKSVMTIRTGGLAVNNNLLYIGFLGLLFTLIKTLAL